MKDTLHHTHLVAATAAVGAFLHTWLRIHDQGTTFDLAVALLPLVSVLISSGHCIFTRFAMIVFRAAYLRLRRH